MSKSRHEAGILLLPVCRDGLSCEGCQKICGEAESLRFQLIPNFVV